MPPDTLWVHTKERLSDIGARVPTWLVLSLGVWCGLVGFETHRLVDGWGHLWCIGWFVFANAFFFHVGGRIDHPRRVLRHNHPITLETVSMEDQRTGDARLVP